MPERLSAHLDRLAAKVDSAPQVLLFTDFDGTLVPIKERPEDCVLDPAVGRALAALAGTGHVAVGVVSGRELEDLQPRVGVAGIAYAGNHGLEIEGPGFAFREPTAVKLSQELAMLVSELARTLAGIPGAWVQDKGLSASVHYRQVAPAAVPNLLEVVHRVAAPVLQDQRFVLRHGKMVLEVRPNVNWNKGAAVKWLAHHMSLRRAESLLIYVGDDETDEDAFAACPEGITIRVGENRNTSANYTASDPLEVHAFLNWLLQVVTDFHDCAGAI